MSAPVNVTPSTINSSHRLLAILSHGATFIGGPLIVPLIIYLVSKNEKSVVATHAAEAFNFHLSFTLWALLCIPLTFVFGLGALLIGILGIAAFVLSIIAVVKAAHDEVYRYPLTLRLLGELPPRGDVVRDM
ncbi:MAG: DUF4870 domain-containing protein [Opitutaceae bacterium]|jgi:uncharacterized protein|nr:DUF4870 domain-containing protein [Opitutaceae bacterium]